MDLALRDRDFIATASGRLSVEAETHKVHRKSVEFLAAPIVNGRTAIWSGIEVESNYARPFVTNSARAATLALIATAVFTSPTTAIAETRPYYREIIGSAKTIAPQRAKLESAMARLDRLAGKQAGWKGEESVPLAASTKEATQSFLRQYFSKQSLPEPFIGLDANGDITLYWKGADFVIDLSIMPDNKFSYYAEFSDVAFEQDETAISPFPDEIIRRLASISA